MVDFKDSSGYGIKIILIFGVNIGILVLVGCVGVICYSKWVNFFYNKILGLIINLWFIIYLFDIDFNNYV